ncbi:TetR/AcrR family transcriptional regulator [Haladaptatus sp. T7]|uniref:TetR/AcrR family transcriptional regulator n=1 Tax=Haladaptatus sp. T7 TaxID=2029368 RepID=UPI0021A255C3|nr:TetR/AcrR family transcriptional regulator [Haladaptatus sp. T7]GKZ12794.1 hypothetical protein HAL_06750 [Haladaptatus sp. T7]
METQRSNGPPPETHEAIMDATCRALCEHGYANLTMKRISDELDKSKSLLHYHYDSKGELLVSFLEYHLDEFATRLSLDECDSAADALSFTVDALFPDPDDSNDFEVTMLEMGMQAPYNDAFREQLQENNARLKDLFTRIFEDGIERGEFEDIDPERAAEHVLILLDGVRGRSVVLGSDEPNEVGRDAIREFIQAITVGDEAQ